MSVVPLSVYLLFTIGTGLYNAWREYKTRGQLAHEANLDRFFNAKVSKFKWMEGMEDPDRHP
jgi:hypothetical protein